MRWTVWKRSPWQQEPQFEKMGWCRQRPNQCLPVSLNPALKYTKSLPESLLTDTNKYIGWEAGNTGLHMRASYQALCTYLWVKSVGEHLLCIYPLRYIKQEYKYTSSFISWLNTSLSRFLILLYLTCIFLPPSNILCRVIGLLLDCLQFRCTYGQQSCLKLGVKLASYHANCLVTAL